MSSLSSIFNEIAKSICNKGIDFTGIPSEFASVIILNLELALIKNTTLFKSSAGEHVHLTKSDTLSTISLNCIYGEEVLNTDITFLSADEGSPLTAILKDAFKNCSNLEYVNLPRLYRLSDNSLYRCTKLTDCYLSTAISLDGNSLNSCTSLSNLKIDKVRNIAGSALTSCKSLSSVDLPSLLTLGNSAFWQCSSLSSLYIPLLKTFDTSIFALCGKLSTITVAEDNLYARCMDDDGNISNSGNILVDMTSKMIKWVSIPVTKHMVVPDQISAIGARCAQGCKNLTYVDCGTAKYIGNVAFYDCSNLVSVILTADYSAYSLPYPTIAGPDAFTTDLSTKKPGSNLSVFVTQSTYDAVQSAPNWNTIKDNLKVI